MKNRLGSCGRALDSLRKLGHAGNISGLRLLALALIAFLFVGCRAEENSLPIWGGPEAVGAEIFLDGKKVGVMEQQVYQGPPPSEDEIKRSQKERRPPPPRPSDIYSTAVAIRVLNGELERAKYSWEGVRVPIGKHEILIVTKEGKRLAKQIDVGHERLYMSIDFNQMTIVGGGK